MREENPITARPSHPSGLQLTYPGTNAQLTHAGPHTRLGIQYQDAPVKPHLP
jgi:hypothetical protein